MPIDLIGTKILVVQLTVSLPPGTDPQLAAQTFMDRLQIPAGYADKTRISIGIADQPTIPRNGILPGA